MAASVAGSLAVFFVGTLAVQMRASLHFGTSALGGAISLYYLAAALGSMPFGRLAERVGGIRVMRAATPAAAVMLALIAAFADSWLALSAMLVAAGFASSAIQPATNLFLARRLPRARQGLAFGVKQASVPAAAALGGLAVPALALTVGWRAAFALAAALGVLAAGLLPRPRVSLAERRASGASHPSPPVLRLPLLVLAVGFGLGVIAANSLTAFVVTSAVHSRITKGGAGLLAAAGAATAAVVRVVSGARADRRGRAHLPVVAAMLAAGGVGYAVLALGVARGAHALLVAGALVAFGAGWGWNGLFVFAIVRSYPDAPARATSITQVSGRLAGVAGPLGFGLLATHRSFAEAWSADAAAAFLGATVILYGRRLLLRSPAARNQTGTGTQRPAGPEEVLGTDTAS